MEKVNLDNALEAESESQVNRLNRELSALRRQQQQQQQQQQTITNNNTNFNLQLKALEPLTVPTIETNVKTDSTDEERASKSLRKFQ